MLGVVQMVSILVGRPFSQTDLAEDAAECGSRLTPRDLPRDTISAERRAPSAERRAPSAERRAPSAMTASGAGAFSGEPCPLSPSSPASASRPPERRHGGAGRRPSPASSRFRALRPARGLCALALALPLLLAAGTAQAQTSFKLVSNTEQSVGNPSTNSTDGVAQPFTTGSYARGYTLTSVTFPASIASTPASLQVRIFSSGSNNKPGSSLGALTLTQSSTTVTGTTTGIDLDANTTYFVVLTGGSATFLYSITHVDNEDGDAAAGWRHRRHEA